MDKLFKLKENGTDVRTEVLAGLTTFFAMSYILFVNPQILSQTGMPAQGVFLATIIGAVAGTLMMAFYANLPYAQAPGMGLNAFFTFTVVFGLGYSWQEALAMVFICGIISLIITLTNVRKMIIESIPNALRSAISAGIGAGGRTGLTALVVAICFAISSFFSPLLAIVPTAATAPILIIVGIMMLGSLKNIHWDDMSEAVPAFFTSIFMGFSYSITQGIAVGFLTYTLTKLVKGQVKDVHAMIWILDALFILNYISMAL